MADRTSHDMQEVSPGPDYGSGALRRSRLETILPPIADYAFRSDCEYTCLVAPGVSIERLCPARSHDGSLFGTMLDHRLGPSA